MKGPTTDRQPSYGDVRAVGWRASVPATPSAEPKARACLEYYGLPASAECARDRRQARRGPAA